jgi:hypothetical protein
MASDNYHGKPCAVCRNVRTANLAGVCTRCMDRADGRLAQGDRGRPRLIKRNKSK